MVCASTAMRLSQHWRFVLYDYALRATFDNIRLKHDAVSRAAHDRASHAVCVVSPSTRTGISLRMPSFVVADVGRAEVGECAYDFKKLGRNALFCIPELGILASFQFNPCCSLFVMSYTTHAPVAFIILSSPEARPRSRNISYNRCHPLGGIHTQARRFEAIDLDPASCVSTSRFRSTLCTR